MGRVKGANQEWGSVLGLILLGPTGSWSMEGASSSSWSLGKTGYCHKLGSEAGREQGRCTPSSHCPPGLLSFADSSHWLD